VSTAVAAILDGMPELAQLRCVRVEDRVVVTVGSRVLFAYDSADTGMAHVAVATLRSLGFGGQTVAAAFGLSEQYVSTLHRRAEREGSAGLVRAAGRPAKLSDSQLARAATWHSQGMSNVDIGVRLGVHNSTVSRALSARAAVAAKQAQDPPQLDLRVDGDGYGSGPPPAAEGPAAPSSIERPATDSDVVPAAGAADSARIGTGSFESRYAGSALLHAFTDRVGASGVFVRAAGDIPPALAGRPRYDDIAVLAATSMVFALGFASLEQAKHPDRAQVGPVAGIDVLPELRTLRPRLAAIAERCDPLALQRSFATAMLAAEPCQTGLYFVDEHFMPYAGALPVGKGWNTKRRHAEPGRVDTMIADAAGRAVCFTSSEPSGLSTTLPDTLAELRAVIGPDAPVMLAFDRGGAYPKVFHACRKADAHWITYRRGNPLTPTGQPATTTVRRNGKDTTVTYTDETVTIKDYTHDTGQARQITLLGEDSTPVLQILTSDTRADPATLIVFMRARWGIENLFKYLDFYGIDYLADYHATITANTRKIDNPRRVELRKQLKALVNERDQLRERIGQLHTDRDITIAALNRDSDTAQRRIHTLEKKITKVEEELKTVPAKLPANLIDPNAARAVHRTQRRALQMVLRLLAANAEHWVANHLNTYLQDEDEYRATSRNLLHLGGTITYTPTTIHIELNRPNTPRLTHALALLLDEINQTPPHIPGDPRPLTYTLKP
jgi:hypothetical protein